MQKNETFINLERTDSNKNFIRFSQLQAKDRYLYQNQKHLAESDRSRFRRQLYSMR